MQFTTEVSAVTVSPKRERIRGSFESSGPNHE